jgi:hypothetical protein
MEMEKERGGWGLKSEPHTSEDGDDWAKKWTPHVKAMST